jgi:hypothetical protein
MGFWKTAQTPDRAGTGVGGLAVQTYLDVQLIWFSIDRLKNVPFIMIDFVSFQKTKVLFA